MNSSDTTFEAIIHYFGPNLSPDLLKERVKLRAGTEEMAENEIKELVQGKRRDLRRSGLNKDIDRVEVIRVSRVSIFKLLPSGSLRLV